MQSTSDGTSLIVRFRWWTRGTASRHGPSSTTVPDIYAYLDGLALLRFTATTTPAMPAAAATAVRTTAVPMRSFFGAAPPATPGAASVVTATFTVDSAVTATDALVPTISPAAF